VKKTDKVEPITGQLLKYALEGTTKYKFTFEQESLGVSHYIRLMYNQRGKSLYQVHPAPHKFKEDAQILLTGY
jgi:hypothetical protein